MFAALRLCGLLTGQNIVPQHFTMAHHRSEAIPEMVRFVGTKVEFGSDRDELALNVDARELPLIHADTYGYVEGDSLRVEYRWAEGQYERFPQFAEDLVKRNVRVIAAGGPPATLAAKSATPTIPIVFITGDDPVKDGLVASFNRPGGNLTGVTVFATASMWGKRLELLHELLPSAVAVAILANPQEPSSLDMSAMISAAQALGIQLSLLSAATDADIEAAFATAAERRIEALLVSDRPFFTVRPKQIAALGARHCLARPTANVSVARHPWHPGQNTCAQGWPARGHARTQHTAARSSR